MPSLNNKTAVIIPITIPWTLDVPHQARNRYLLTARFHTAAGGE